MTDAELIALAALVNADVAEVQAANQYRKSCGYSPAYDGFMSKHCETIVAELERRKAKRNTSTRAFEPTADPTR